METSDIVWETRKEAIRDLVKSGKRLDGRKPDEYRKIEFIEDYIQKAQGSCLVKLGDTQVLVGVKMEVGEPYPDSANRGNLSTSCELVPLASPDFSTGPPGEESIETARVVDRGIRESKMIDLEAICITEGKEVWTAMLDIHVLDHHGNLIDASSLASVKALMNTRLPKYEDGKVLHKVDGKQLPVRDKPVSSTFVKINGVNLLDPTFEEEKVMDARMTIVTTEEGNICAMQKSGSGTYNQEEIEQMIDLAMKKGKEIREQY